MCTVNDVDLVLAVLWRNSYLLDDASISSILLFEAASSSKTLNKVRRRQVKTVDCPCENSCRSCFSYTSGSAKKVCLSDLA